MVALERTRSSSGSCPFQCYHNWTFKAMCCISFKLIITKISSECNGALLEKFFLKNNNSKNSSTLIQVLFPQGLPGRSFSADIYDIETPCGRKAVVYSRLSQKYKKLKMFCSLGIFPFLSSRQWENAKK